MTNNLIQSCDYFVASLNCLDNYFYYNNILDILNSPPCQEDNSANIYQGNYWDTYKGIDNDGNGYSDIPYIVATPNSTDPNPHDTPWGSFPIMCKNVEYQYAIAGNTVVSDIIFNTATNCTEFSVALPSNLTGEWVLTPPRSLQDGQFKVLMDNNPVPTLLSWNETYTSINFTCPGSASKTNRKAQVISSVVLQYPPTSSTTVLTPTQWADVNGDGVVNIIDIALVAKHFTQTCPPHSTS